jgi:metallo-beta-lactamase family protein
LKDSHRVIELFNLLNSGGCLPYIQFLGAAGTVTGSKHLISVSGGDSGKTTQVLVDCGLFQGKKEWRERNWKDLPLGARDIDCLILTHAHLDHCGWIPRLVKQGFRGPIYATPATVDLCSILLPDSGHLQEEDAAFHNKHKTSRHDPALPLYTLEEAQDCLQYFKPIDFGQATQISPQLSFRFVHAAHILGSSMAEVTVEGAGTHAARLLFTGDIGRVHDQHIAPGKVVYSGPQTGETADVLVMESTYGNRRHPTDDPRPGIAALIRQTAERGGSVVVPAFAVERTQKFIFMLKEMMESGQAPRVPVYCDSPMAIKAVEVFLKHEEEYSDTTKQLISRYGSPLTWQGFTFAETAEQSKKINDCRFPCVIISSSGMVTGGRILHHLAQRLPDPKNTVIFIGFQAPGTRGFTIKSGEPEVKIFGQMVPIRAQVAAFEQFSDHADTPELLEWLHTFPQKPGITYLVHGEPDAASQLQSTMTKELGWNVKVAQWMEKAEVE